MQRIFRLLLVVSAIIVGGFWFVHWSNTRALNSGEVHVRQQPAGDAKSGTPQNDATSTESNPSDSTNQPAQEVASNAGDQPRPQPEIIATIPASESLSRQSSNGIVAAGTGKFELYRQGDLTFRLNTESGDACVLFATEQEWRKSLVYEHGCNSHR
jgi:hypothetical protein